MRSERIIIAIVIASLALMAVPFSADVSDASGTYSVNGVNVTIFDDTVDLSAGGSVTTAVTFINNNATMVSVHLSYSSTAGSPVNSSVDTKEFDLEGSKAKQVNATFTTDRLSKHGMNDVTLMVTVYSYDGGGSSSTVSVPIKVNIVSAYSSDDVFNKILGIFPPLEEPFDIPAFTALITMGIWVLLALFTFLLLRVIVFAIFKNDKVAAREISNKTGIMLVISILFYGLSNAMMVFGADETVIAFLKNLASFIYIPIVAYIVWNIYTNVIQNIFHRLEQQDKIAGADSSLIPLFNMLGEIVIVVVAASALLGTMGFDLMAIMTGAGIAGMAISLGAQNTLTEFFSGINLMATRPFKRGDMVMIGSDDIYQVEKVGLLNSRFKNWISMEYIIMPNSKVSDSTIMNITDKTMAYRMSLYYTVAYDSDVELTKQILVDTACNHPQVIVDGSYSKPSARLEAFEDSAIKFKLSVYINDFRDYITVSDELNEDIFRNLCKAGIEIPFNKLDVYVGEEGQ